MNYTQIYTHETINGLGLRVSLFVSGCTLHCYNCFNKSAWDFTYGQPFTEEIEDSIIKRIFNDKINFSGLSILGGEPLDNIEGLKSLVKKFNDKNSDGTKNIWLWSGYTPNEIMRNEIKSEFVFNNCDIVVLGRYIDSKKDLTLKFRGSTNQKIYRVDKENKKFIEVEM